MKVYLKYRNYKKIHPIFQSLIANPPEGVEYYFPEAIQGMGSAYKIYNRFGHIKLVGLAAKWLQAVLFKPSESKYNEYDVVHLVDQIPANYDSANYVIDIGAMNSVNGFYKIHKSDAIKIKNFLVHRSCKTIIVRSASTMSALNEFCKCYVSKNELNEIKKKTQLVYPAINRYSGKKKYDKSEHTKSLRLLFIGNGVFKKGLHETIEAYLQLKKKGFKVTLTAVANDYRDLPEKYLQSDVNFYEGKFSKKEIMEKFFSTNDVFIMPSHYEIFGMVYLDAYSAGLPCIGINQYSSYEIIQDKVTGFLLESDRRPMDEDWNLGKISTSNLREPEQKIVDQIYIVIQIYLMDRDLVKVHGRAGQALVESGKFSIKSRNKKLKVIYEKAVQ